MNRDDQYPPGISQGEGAILDAIAVWRHEERELSNAKHDQNQTRMDTLEREMVAMAAAVKLAYPDGDADGHRRFHEEMIRKAAERAQFYQDLRTKLAEKGIWALFVLLAIALWAFIKAKVVS